MERGTLGERRGPDVAALYAEAESLLSRSANELRAITEHLRQEIADGLGAQPGEGTPVEAIEDLARARSLLLRLELTTRELEDDWRFLERGAVGGWSDGGRAFVDQPGFGEPGGRRIAKRILEAQEQERARLAEEIHDGPAQALANAAFQAEIVERQLARDPEAAREELRAMRRLVNRELEKMRAFIHELRPNLDDGGLSLALADTAERVATETGIQVILELDAPEDALDPEGRTAVLRVAQEALRNVGKHSGAERVIVATRTEAAPVPGGIGWILEVSDDGQGFSVDDVLEQSARRHFGLRFMRERAQLVNASLEITSNDASGTTVRLRLEPAERSR